MADFVPETVTVTWRHPSIRLGGRRYGQTVELSRDDAEAYARKRWCDPPPPIAFEPGEIADPDAYAAALRSGTVVELEEAPDVPADSEE